jgi:hypothetical protein
VLQAELSFLNVLRHIHAYILSFSLLLLYPVQSLINFVCTVHYSSLYMYITSGLLYVYIHTYIYIYCNGDSNRKYSSTRVRIKRAISLYKCLCYIYYDKISHLRVSIKNWTNIVEIGGWKSPWSIEWWWSKKDDFFYFLHLNDHQGKKRQIHRICKQRRMMMCVYIIVINIKKNFSCMCFVSPVLSSTFCEHSDR